MPTRCNRRFLFQILLLAQHVSGTIMPIIRSSRVLYRWLLPVVFGALLFKLSVWCGVEGYVSGLQAAALQHVEQAIKSAIKIVCCIQLAFYFHTLTTMHGQNQIKLIQIMFHGLSRDITKHSRSQLMMLCLLLVSAVTGLCVLFGEMGTKV